MSAMRLALAAMLLGVFMAIAPAGAGQDDSRLPRLFERLKVAPPAEAAAIQQAIWEIWTEAPDDTSKLLMLQGITAMQQGAMNQAIDSFAAIVDRAPGFAEGWNKRATALFLAGDFEASVADIERTLRLEPRHWGALSGLGQINTLLGRGDAALKAYEKALEINPHLDSVRSAAEGLRKTEGRRGI